MRIGFDARLINETGVGRYIQNIIPHLVLNKKVNWVFIVRKSEKELLTDKDNASQTQRNKPVVPKLCCK